jgi:hypothetical protein
VLRVVTKLPYSSNVVTLILNQTEWAKKSGSLELLRRVANQKFYFGQQAIQLSEAEALAEKVFSMPATGGISDGARLYRWSNSICGIHW